MNTANDNGEIWKPGDPRPANLPSSPDIRALMVETVRDLWGDPAADEISAMFEAPKG